MRQNVPLALSWLVILVVLLRSAMPVGFMPGEGMAKGWMPLVICTGTGPSTVYVPAGKVPAPGEHHAGDTGICAFAAVFAQGVLGSLPVLIPALNGGHMFRDMSAFLLPASAATPYSAQGPPAA